MLVLAGAVVPATAADLPAPDDFYRVWGRVQVAGTTGGHREPDPRTVPWHTIRRLALLGGEFSAPYRPVSAGEITALLVDAVEGALVGELERVAGSGRAVDERALDGALRARVDLVLDGARKRNERVRAPGTPTRPGPGTTPRAEAR